MPTVNDYTALLSGSYWGGIEVAGRPTIVTFSFPTSAPGYVSSTPGFTAATMTSYAGFSSAEQSQALAALGEWAAASGIVFVQVAPGEGDINFQKVDFDTTSGPSYSGAGGIGFYPFGNWDYFSHPSYFGDLDLSGDVFMNTQFETGSGASATLDYGTLLHEIGHALGLKHPTEVVTDYAVVFPNPPIVHDQLLASDDPNVTIMATIGGGTGHLQSLDQDAVAFIYGAQLAGKPDVVTASASATYNAAQNAFVASWSWDAITETMTQTGRATDDTIRGTSVHDVINGGNGNDKLYGLAGADTLNGGAGNDTLHGGGGADRMVGSTGNDTYFVDDAGDIVVEGATQGTADIVYATVSYTLANNVETLQMFGSGLTGQGNNSANTIYGDGTYADNLNGRNGDDYIASFGGADTVHGGNQNDTIFGGDGADKLYGDANDDWLIGEADNDVINGGTGNDTIIGGAGKDNLAGGTGNDVFVFEALADSGTTGATRDTITDFKEESLAITEADQIDLWALGSLEFVGTTAFTGGGSGPVQIRYEWVGTNTIVYVDADRNATTDMTIMLVGQHTLANIDFGIP